MTDLRAQLQATLGSGYSLERELGGGGMLRDADCDHPESWVAFLHESHHRF